jgi:hypothetical protein
LHLEVFSEILLTFIPGVLGGIVVSEGTDHFIWLAVHELAEGFHVPGEVIKYSFLFLQLFGSGVGSLHKWFWLSASDLRI